MDINTSEFVEHKSRAVRIFRATEKLSMKFSAHMETIRNQAEAHPNEKAIRKLLKKAEFYDKKFKNAAEDAENLAMYDAKGFIDRLIYKGLMILTVIAAIFTLAGIYAGVAVALTAISSYLIGAAGLLTVIAGCAGLLVLAVIGIMAMARYTNMLNEYRKKATDYSKMSEKEKKALLVRNERELSKATRLASIILKKTTIAMKKDKPDPTFFSTVTGFFSKLTKKAGMDDVASVNLK